MRTLAGGPFEAASAGIVAAARAVQRALDEQKSNPRTLPKSEIRVAVRYALNQGKPLLAFTTDGRLSFDNIDTEHDLPIGEKNWLLVGSAVAGDVAATMHTLVPSASRHNLDQWAYLNHVLRRLSGGEPELDALLPARWAESHPKSIRNYRR